MFYYPNVLQRHTGCFATIWLAATGATRLLKREYLKVNIPQTCDDIIAFILVQVPPIIPGTPRPRFSLYLSAQLQYGIVRVYSRQCQYLAGTILYGTEGRSSPGFPSPSTNSTPNVFLSDEIQQTLERLNRMQLAINLIDQEQPMLLLPDQLTLMEALEEAPDPFFGVMVPSLPSPAYIPYVQGISWCPYHPKSPERSRHSCLPRRRVAIAGEPHITVSPDDITLKEAEPIRLLQIEEGFVVPGEERLPLLPSVSPRKRRRAGEESVEEFRKKEPSVPLGLSPPTRTEKEPLAVGETGVLLEEVEAPPLPLEITPPRPGLAPSPRLRSVSPKRPPPLSPEEMVLLPAKRLRTPAELLGAPTYGWMHPTLHSLWARCANLQRMDYAKQRRREEEEEEPQRPAEVPSELEVLREAEEPSVPLVGSSEVSLETTEEELRASLVAAEERVLPEPEEVGLPMLPEVPEISFELPLDKEMLTLTDVRRLVAAKLEQTGETEFAQLVPFTVSRDVASRFFYMCLVLAGDRYLLLEQEEPFGRIVIKPGAWFRPS
uniref:Uncharacterized protein n=1 Tax=Sphaerodactylus townsendi TaxID=933632 RepID=A0ACB8EWW6_9SAUR